MDFYKAIEQRRSRYGITDASPVSDGRIQEILAHAVTYTPSAFHSQSARVILLLGQRHRDLWELVAGTLQPLVPPERFGATREKLDSFAAGHGTILYFEDMAVVEGLQQQFPTYADNFSLWSQQSAGMLQFAVWTALAQEGLGASLQHYNPLVDGAVAQTFGAPPHWKLLAQMPFGTPVDTPAPLERQPLEGRLLVQGGAL